MNAGSRAKLIAAAAVILQKRYEAARAAWRVLNPLAEKRD